MKINQVSLNSLRPSQLFLDTYRIRPLLGDSFRPDLFEPIPVLKTDTGNVMGGGHHRTYLFYLAHRLYGISENIPAIFAENEKEITELFEGSLRERNIGDLMKHRAHEHIKDIKIRTPNNMEKPTLTVNGANLIVSSKENTNFGINLGKLPSKDKFVEIQRKSYS